MNGRLGTVFKILHFAAKNEWPFGYNCKIFYFPVKKPLAVWVHALLLTQLGSMNVIYSMRGLEFVVFHKSLL